MKKKKMEKKYKKKKQKYKNLKEDNEELKDDYKEIKEKHSPNREIKIIKNWNDFETWVNQQRDNNLYRGHSRKKYKLDTKLARTFKTSKEEGKNFRGPFSLWFINSTDVVKNKIDINKHSDVLKMEEIMLKEIESIGHLYSESRYKNFSKLEKISLLQHHGAPTRFLDVSKSPYIALFFSIFPYEDKNGKLYSFNSSKFEVLNSYNELKNTKNDRIFIFNPKVGNERLSLQQGLFLIPSNIGKNIEDILDETGKESYSSVIISKEFKKDAVNKLRKMNITAKSLFPGMDGLAKSIEWLISDEFK